MLSTVQLKSKRSNTGKELLAITVWISLHTNSTLKQVNLLCCDRCLAIAFSTNTFLFFCRAFKSILLMLFTIWTSVSIYYIPTIDIGLDQQLTMSTDSHVYKYFQVSTSPALQSFEEVCNLIFGMPIIPTGNGWITGDGTTRIFCFEHIVTVKWKIKSKCIVRWPAMRWKFSCYGIVHCINKFGNVCQRQ